MNYMYMDEQEICRFYHEALHKADEIEILAQLNACKIKDIKEILSRNGYIEETKKQHAVGKPREILRLDPKTGKILKEWKTTAEATRYFHLGPTSIYKACHGLRGTAGGFKWRYKDETEHDH